MMVTTKTEYLVRSLKSVSRFGEGAQDLALNFADGLRKDSTNGCVEVIRRTTVVSDQIVTRDYNFTPAPTPA